MNKTQGYFIAIAIVITLVYLFYGPSANMTHHPGHPNIDFLHSLPQDTVTEAPPPVDEPMPAARTAKKEINKKTDLPQKK